MVPATQGMLEVIALVLIAIALVLALFKFGLKQKMLEAEHLEKFFRRRN